MINTARVILWACVNACLLSPLVRASTVSCQVRCPDGMQCTRLGGSNFHVCMRRLSVNTTSEQAANDRAPRGMEGAGPRVEGRGDSQSICPRPPVPAGPCVVQCRYLSDCLPGQACCSNGCGRTCTAVRPDEVTKPGSCPLLAHLATEACGTRCQGDAECPGHSKCCRSRCGSTCMAPCFHWLRNSRVINPWRLSRRCSRDSFSLFSD